MEWSELCRIYGELMVQKEIIDNKIIEVKKMIQQELLSRGKDVLLGKEDKNESD